MIILCIIVKNDPCLMADRKFSISIIIPVYNEERFLMKMLSKLDEITLPECINRSEVIVVDDCSSDNSAEIARQFKAATYELKLITNSRNRGKGAALKEGISSATGDTLLFQDSDLELEPEDIPHLIKGFSGEVKLVNGSRYLKKGDNDAPALRTAANRFFTFLVNVVSSGKLTDVTCGYKLIDSNLMRSLDLKESKFGIDTELVIKVLRAAGRNSVKEVPVKYYPRGSRDGRKIRNKDAFRILWVIFKYGVLGR